nr:16S rRNA methyltransferase [Archaeoglobus neptunius]
MELVPPEIACHPSVAFDARRRGKNPDSIILDDSKHHSAMKKLPFREKRGRPDIIHQCLLLLLDSPVSKDLEIYVHTLSGHIIKVNPKTRLPRNYNRFVGLMEDLFRKRRIVAGNEILLEIVDQTLSDILAHRNVILMSEKGRRENIGKYLKGDFAVCIGAFPHGDFFPETRKMLKNANIVSLGEKGYTSLYVTARVVCEYERVRAVENR